MNIIELAREAGFWIDHPDDCPTIYNADKQRFERFVYLVRQQALEEAAGVVEDMDVQHPKYIAAAIRALKGETK
jgi:hypothetical protein